MTPKEWYETLAPGVSYRLGDRIVASEALKVLLTLPEGRVINTAQLVEAMFPAKTAKGPEIAARARIVRTLMKPSLLANCRTRDEINVRQWYGRTVQPWLWHRPEPKRCPHCGGILDDNG